MSQNFSDLDFTSLDFDDIDLDDVAAGAKSDEATWRQAIERPR